MRPPWHIPLAEMIIAPCASRVRRALSRASETTLRPSKSNGSSPRFSRPLASSSKILSLPRKTAISRVASGLSR